MVPLARNTDPVESHLAAAEISNDGTKDRMVAAAYQAVCQRPGMTANELEFYGGYRDGQLRKRLTELERTGMVVRGPVRLSEVTGKKNCTWLPSPSKES